VKTIDDSPEGSSHATRVLLAPILAVVFVGFLVTGLALPVLPLHVHHSLGLGTFVVGLVTGSQFVAALLTRMWAGSCADTQGAKRAVVVGMCTSSIAGLLYLVSVPLMREPALSGAFLLLGRFVLGAGESFIITGALGWGVALVGSRHTGKVMAWMGTAMYAAFAAGAPAGAWLYGQEGFAGIAWATLALPLAILVLLCRLPAVPPATNARPAFTAVLRAVWVPGLGLALTSLGFGAIAGFVALLFAAKTWTPVWHPFTAFAVSFMLARILLGHVVDKLGGARVALVSIVIESAGLALLWIAPSFAWAVGGAALTGLGYSLVYPGFGVEAVRRTPPQSSALAMGAYTACLDLALGVGTLALGAVASQWGLGSVFLASAVVVALAAVIGVWLLAQGRTADVALPPRLAT
jgi:MFS family permease